jgi:hypothetical protein
MNMYITTIDLRSIGHSNVRMAGRGTILNACIDALTHAGVTINGIITPEWANLAGLETYRGIAVQTLKTRDMTNYGGDCNMDLSPKGSLKDCEILCKTERSPQHHGDNEHQTIFEMMEVETPCLISDGDMIMPLLDQIIDILEAVPLKHKRSMILMSISHLIYLHNQEDKDGILLYQNSEKFKTIERVVSHLHRSITHIPRGVLNFLCNHGYRLNKITVLEDT